MFSFNNLVPIPLSDQLETSDIWGTTFAFDAATRYFVEAPSGKGKTTFQHILYGLRKDYTGDVRINALGGEYALTELSLDQWADIRQRELSVVFQDLRLFLELTALENIQLKNNLTNHQPESAIVAMATELGVEHLLEKKCGQMSYGQRQRIAIIRALCQPFRFLIMDEPFSHLDKNNIEKCCQLISRECQKQGAGFAIASLEERYFFDYDQEVKI
ncbi:MULTISPECIES: ATP-binding cassette domain-containing protein [unclassified Aureispira]|uniref:ABC transporter ATP-binding protein n=1 Tax=unclassified Aureispira TaxID=2649989 RepID=UPI0006974FED|nr:MULTISPECIES: ATP-binding cassette domain-containing protein [unclassified Aureispira]WMX13312.1 ATP-binding cassette domain-containing protein [Aureispira sp. CCB-E]